MAWDGNIFFSMVCQWHVACYYKITATHDSDVGLEYGCSNSVTYIEISMEPIYFLLIESNLG